MNFSTIDWTIFIGYLCCIIGFGIFLSRRGKGTQTAKDYFLASGALPWWAIGGSLIASNISTEQILGMNGSGYVMGMAIASYELMAALTLIIVAKFLLPVFINKGIYTMPQFLEQRFDGRVRLFMAVFWVALFVFVNITTILYLGSLAIQNIMGWPLLVGIIGLVIYSATFSIFGGLKAVVWTDVAQVVVLVFGGLMASYLIVSTVGDGGFFNGLAALYEKAPDKFNMILEKGHPSYNDLPGISVLIGGMWIANMYYWGANQYIIQRALAAKSIAEAQKGVAFAAFLKLFMPLFVVIPGIAAFVLSADIAKPDEAFPWVLNNYVGIGFKGLVFAALVAALGSSISSVVNSASTIFTLDIYKPLFRQNKTNDDKHLVRVGKIAAAIILVIGALIAPALGSLDQVFQYIQEYTGFISPGVIVVFIFGMFWKRATSNAALTVILAAIPLSWFLKVFSPELPFLDRMGFSFLVLSALMVGISLFENKVKATSKRTDQSFILFIIVSLLVISVPSGFTILLEDSEVSSIFGIIILGLSLLIFVVLWLERRQDDAKAITIPKNLFKTNTIFNVATVVICLVLTAIYTIFW